MSSWIPTVLPVHAAGSTPKRETVDSKRGLWLLPTTSSPHVCSQPLQGLPAALAARVLPPITVVSMAREYSGDLISLSGFGKTLVGGSATLPERWVTYADAGVPSSALSEIHSPMLPLHPLSAFETMPWLLSPGVSAAWWSTLCARGIVTLKVRYLCRTLKEPPT